MRVVLVGLITTISCMAAFVHDFDSAPGPSMHRSGTFRSQHSISPWQSTGGNPGGYLLNRDREDFAGQTSYHTTTWYFSSPTGAHGNHSDAYGGNLRFQLRAEGDSTGAYTPQPKNPVSDFRAAGLTLGYFGLGAPGANWTGYSVPLQLAPGWRKWDNFSQYRTDIWVGGEFQTALANVTSIWIRGNYYDARDVTGIDNISFSAIPEPATFFRSPPHFCFCSGRAAPIDPRRQGVG